MDYPNLGTFDDFELPSPDDPPRSPTPEFSPEDVGEVEVEQAVVAQSRKAEKGKWRADPVEQDDPSNPDANGVEDDIAQGLEEVENAQNDEENAPPAKKPRKEPVKAKKPREKRIIKTPVERAYRAAGVCLIDSDGCRFSYPRWGATGATPPLQALGVVASRESYLWAV